MKILDELEGLEEMLREREAQNRRDAEEETGQVRAMRFGQAEAFRIAADWLEYRIEIIRKELAA
jgi:hypothetical protein